MGLSWVQGPGSIFSWGAAAQAHLGHEVTRWDFANLWCLEKSQKGSGVSDIPPGEHSKTSRSAVGQESTSACV